ncbi:hypothetical protein LMG32289_06036 [Cupriavidus pampae]|uniref:Transposase n=1 Tax=Cupriavidus pampae TaxID=659251 RepID=A0ABN7ZMZ6_9BURK|nr:hypothetical protein LMG32289_06036 [Cupriavidus pampae]
MPSHERRIALKKGSWFVVGHLRISAPRGAAYAHTRLGELMRTFFICAGAEAALEQVL